jgi:hypothetical protein
VQRGLTTGALDDQEPLLRELEDGLVGPFCTHPNVRRRPQHQCFDEATLAPRTRTITKLAESLVQRPIPPRGDDTRPTPR